MDKGKIYLIPTYLSESNDANFLAPMVIDIVKNTEYYLVENIRTARRFISSLKLGLDIPSLTFEQLDKKTTPEMVHELMQEVVQGKNVGIMSEAGLPGLADPGSLAIKFAHQHGLQVVPLPGPSSIQTAVINSGFSGQQFSFNGYLPIQKAERIARIKGLQTHLNNTKYTQVFMETPFRNMNLMDDLLDHLDNHTLLSVSSDVFGAKEFILTQTVRAWKKSEFDLHKIPTVFCIGHFS